MREARHVCLLAALAASIDDRSDWPTAAGEVRALMFVERVDGDIEDHRDRLGDSDADPTAAPPQG